MEKRTDSAFSGEFRSADMEKKHANTYWVLRAEGQSQFYYNIVEYGGRRLGGLL